MGNIYRGSQIKRKIPVSNIAPSIPSKYDKTLNENPEPGSYDCVSTVEPQGHFSQKGTAGLIESKAPQPQAANPGPNAFNLQGTFLNKSDFNTGASRVFKLPVAVLLDGLKDRTPAPNQYDVCHGRSQRPFSLDGRVPFLSTTERMSFNPHKDAPSPCHYNVNHTLTQTGSRVVVSPFKSKTHRIPGSVDNGVPGPGAYSPHQPPKPVKRTILPRGCYLAIASPPEINPKPPPAPGPGHYDGLIYKGPTKHPIPSAAFASKTARIPRQYKSGAGPGPGYYDPLVLTKQSFFFCDTRKWIPV